MEKTSISKPIQEGSKGKIYSESEFLKAQAEKTNQLPQVTMEELLSHLASKKQFEKVTKLRGAHLLAPDEEEESEKVAIVSQTNYGNVLVQTCMEVITGLVTGSDSSMKAQQHFNLFQNGKIGEGIIDDRVWMIRSTYPVNVTQIKTCQIDRAILVVRSPIDEIFLMMNQILFGKEDQTIFDYDLQHFHKEWTSFFCQEVTVWRDFNEFWIKSKIPVHIIRFEDLLNEPSQTLTEAMQFVLNTKSIEGKVVKKYIDLVIPWIKKQKKKIDQLNPQKSYIAFTKQHYEFLLTQASECLKLLGYEYLCTEFERLPTFRDQLNEFNAQSLAKSIQNQESEEVISLKLNDPVCAVRNQNSICDYPRPYGNFIQNLRQKVTSTTIRDSKLFILDGTEDAQPLQHYGQYLRFERIRDEGLEALPGITLSALKAQFLQPQSNEVHQKMMPHKLIPTGLPNDEEKVLIVSYPRSGNTLNRAYLEKLSGTVTGSDSGMSATLCQQLVLKGMYGECLTDDRVWFIKSHYPERLGKDANLNCNKAILCVRNPIDSLVSHLNMITTCSQSKTNNLQEREGFKENWSKFVRQEITTWYDFNKFWMSQSIPVHIVRYEDLIVDPVQVYREVMKFLLDSDSIAGTTIEKLIELVCKEEAPQMYALKNDPSKIKGCQHKQKYDQEDLDFIFSAALDLIHEFGYEGIFTPEGQPTLNSELVTAFNASSLAQCKQMQTNKRALKINDPPCELRQPTENYPEGRDLTNPLKSYAIEAKKMT